MKLSELKCNPDQLDRLHKLGMPEDIQLLVDAIDWLQLDKGVFVTVDIENFYHIGHSLKIHVCDFATDIYRSSYERYERCLVEGLYLALDLIDRYPEDSEHTETD